MAGSCNKDDNPESEFAFSKIMCGKDNEDMIFYG